MGSVHLHRDLLEPPVKQPPKSNSLAPLLLPPPPGMPPRSPHLSLASMLLAAPAAIPRPRGTVWGLMWRMSTRWWSPSTTGASLAAGLLRHSPSGLKSLHAHRSALHLSHFQSKPTLHFRPFVLRVVTCDFTTAALSRLILLYNTNTNGGVVWCAGCDGLPCTSEHE